MSFEDSNTKVVITTIIKGTNLSRGASHGYLD